VPRTCILLQVLALVGAAACNESVPEKTPTLFSPPPVPRPLAPPVSDIASALPLPSASASDRSLTRVAFVVQTTVREDGLKHLTRTQLDTVDRAFLGRFDIHAFVEPGCAVTAWLDGDAVVAADVQLKDKRHVRAAWYPGPASPPGWYDQAGLSLQSEILGRPIALSRLTSRYGERLHPITGDRRLHRGLDYGAPEGTPIYAVGDGVVRARATDDGAGNHLKIAHARGYESWYLHLSAFAPEATPGARVKQGQVIGFVGTTGRSTGPHLHYELHQGPNALDPTMKLPLPQAALGPIAKTAHTKKLEALP
jgi:murein DD-endopeptidase MepM/ murein hydrolase activator NlpD